MYKLTDTLVEQNTRDEILFPKIISASENDTMMVCEVGVFRLGNLLRLAQYAKENNKIVQFYGIDSFCWSNISGQALEGVDIVDGSPYETCKKILLESGLAEYIILIQGDSIVVAKSEWFVDGSLDLIFLDGCHHRDYLRDEIRAWLPKLKVGGICSGHDAPDAEIRSGLFDVFDEGIINYTSCGSSWWVQL